MLVPQAAVAQDNDEEVIEEIITTGYRSSLMNSISAKRNASSIVESISAEDIGKLPDASIGESLARLPGLAAQRFDGRAGSSVQDDPALLSLDGVHVAAVFHLPYLLPHFLPRRLS